MPVTHRQVSLVVFAGILCLLTLTGSAFAQPTAFTYQGRLNTGANPASGNFDLAFTLFDALTNGNATAGPVTNLDLPLDSNGLFTAAVDFGANAFTGSNAWLEIAVRTNGGGGFITLSPRQFLTPAPYALYAANASNLAGVLPAGSLSGAYSNAVSLNNSNNSFAGNGAGLIRLDASQLLAGTVPDARLSTNVALLNAIQTFTGANTFANNNPNATPLRIAGTAAQNTNLFQITDANRNNVFRVSSNNSVFMQDGALFNLDTNGNAAMFWNGSHPGDGEFQITSAGALSINAGYDFSGHSEIQIGSSGSYHDEVHIQYDLSAGPVYQLGYSKMFDFRVKAWNGSVPLIYQLGMQAQAVNTNGDLNLVFYNPSPKVFGSGDGAIFPGGVRQGAMLSKGWEFNGKMVRSLAATNASSTCMIDFNAPQFVMVNVLTDTTFAVTNLILNNQVQQIELDLYPGFSASQLTFPTNFIWRNETGNATAPTNLAQNTVMFLELKAMAGPVLTNIDAHYTLGAYTPLLDTNASIFFSAAAITNNLHKIALNQLVLDLKGSNLWSRADCIYPFVGGNAAAHSINLKDINHFNILWHGTLIHDANGVTGDASTGYGDTQFTPATAPSPNYVQNSASLAVYNKTASVPGATPTWLGYANNVRASMIWATTNLWTASGFNNTQGTGVDLVISGMNSGTLLTVSRTASNAEAIYLGVNQPIVNTTASTGVPNGSFYILAENNTGLWHPSGANIAFAWIGGGLSSADQAALNAIVLRFETTLGRQ